MKSFLPAIAASLSTLSTLAAAPNGGNPAGIFNVRDYGATGDGRHLDSPAIDQAIAAAAQAGGGTVMLPAGTYLSGSIHLRSNIHLVIGAGATILGAPQEMNAYDETEVFPGIAYQDGGHCYFHNSLIWGENLVNVTISGPGTIHGGGMTSNSGVLDTMCGYHHFPTLNTETHPPVRLGNKAIALKLCKNVAIREITILHGGHFAILATGIDNLTLDGLTIDTNRDGIDIDCCRNTMVANCRVNSPHDDGICPKSTCALGEPRVTENLTITNCQVSGFKEGTLIDGSMVASPGGTGRIKFGTESSGGFRNCTVSNCTFRSCHGLAIEEVDGGIMENLLFDNLAMTDVRSYAIYITSGTRNRSPAPVQPARGRNIRISHVIADRVDPMSGIEITGLPDQPLDGIRLENIHLTSMGGGTAKDAARQPKELGNGYPEPGKIGTMPAYGIFARHVRNLELADIRLDFLNHDARPAAVFQDIHGLDIDHLVPQTADGVAAATFAADVADLTIRNSPSVHGP